MSRHWLPAVLVLGATLVATTTACSQNSTTGTAGAAVTTAATTTPAAPAAAQIPGLVKAATSGASAVHVKGTVTDSGTTVTLDLQLNKDGSGSGTMVAGGQNLHVIAVKGVDYLQFTADLMKANGIDATSAAGKLLLNKWVPSTSQLMSGSDLVGSMKQVLDYNTFIGNIASQMPPGAPKPGKSDTVNGVPVVLYTFSDGTLADVATTSPHYLMRLAPGKAEGSGQVDFTNWNQPVAITAPPASEIYNGPAS